MMAFTMSRMTQTLYQVAGFQNPPSDRSMINKLPNEVLHEILYYAALSRGVTRALRLKLVCRRFNAHLDLALFKTRLLDTFEDRQHSRFTPGFEAVQNSRMRQPNGADRFWRSYFAWRVTRENDPESSPSDSFYDQLQRVTKEYCSLSGANEDEMVNAVCLLATEKRLVARWSCGNLHTHWHNSEDLGADLLALATYLDCISLVKDLLRDGYDHRKETTLFPSPLFLAGYTGNIPILRLFQRYSITRGYVWGKSFSFEPTGGVLQLGNLDVLRVAAAAPYDVPVGRISELYPKQLENRGKYLFNAKTVETFIYARDLRPEKVLPSKIGCLLANHAGYGNMELMSHLLEKEGLTTNEKKLMSSQALIRATMRSQEEAVDLLLERGGADPNNFRKPDGGSAIRAAARAGSLAIVRKLLDHGICLLDECDKHDQNLHGKPRQWSRRHPGNCSQEYHMAVFYAVRQEHTAMLELLLERKKPYETGSLKVIAELEGLESMVEVLKNYDERVSQDPRPRRGGWTGRGGEIRFPNLVLKDVKMSKLRHLSSTPTTKRDKSGKWD